MLRTKTLAVIFSTLPLFAIANEPLWSYEGKGGPENWGTLNKAFTVCHSGKFQSPVDIKQTLDAHLPPLDLVFKTTSETLINNGHTIQVTAGGEDSFLLDGENFRLVQYHFHTPSENKIKGEAFPLEAHFVHTNENGDTAVVAVMFMVGKENGALKPVISSFPMKRDQSVAVTERVDLSPLFPKDLSYYRFSGSLTTPPCTEGIRWIVMRHPVSLSLQQLTAFQKELDHTNNRPVQPMNGRIVVQ